MISKKLRNEVREYFVCTTIAKIEMEFSAADIDCNYEYSPKISGQRRGLVEQHYCTLDFSDSADEMKFVKLTENILLELNQKANSDLKSGQVIDNREWAKDWFNKIKALIERDGYSFDGSELHSKIGNAHLIGAKKALGTVNSDYIKRQIERIFSSIETEPSLAIGSSKELIETVCKTILDERKIQYDKNDEINDLVKKVRAELKLIPEDIPENAKGAKTIKSILGNLATISQGIAELRNAYGSGHGKSSSFKGLSPRHARLAAGASSTLVNFLFETHLEKKA